MTAHQEGDVTGAQRLFTKGSQTRLALGNEPTHMHCHQARQALSLGLATGGRPLLIIF